MLFEGNKTRAGSKGTQINGTGLDYHEATLAMTKLPQLRLGRTHSRNIHCGDGVQVNGIQVRARQQEAHRETSFRAQQYFRNEKPNTPTNNSYQSSCGIHFNTTVNRQTNLFEGSSRGLAEDQKKQQQGIIIHDTRAVE